MQKLLATSSAALATCAVGATLGSAAAHAQVAPEFAPHVVTEPATAGMSIAESIDLNGDGANDAVLLGVTPVGQRPVLALARGIPFSPRFEVATIIAESLGSVLFVVDVDHDGDMDLVTDVIVDEKRRIAWLENDGGAEFTGHIGPEFGAVLRSPRLGDRDGDGNIDLYVLLGNEQGLGTVATVELVPGGFGGTFQRTGIRATTIDVADFDGDSQSEIVTISDGQLPSGDLELWNGASIPLAPGQGSGMLLASDARPLAPELIRDVNLDGLPDIVVLTGAGAQAFLGDGTATAAATALTVDPVNTAMFGDLDGDGIDDLLYLKVTVFPEPLRWTWSRSTGALPFASGEELTVSGQVIRNVLDFDGDQRDDLVSGTRVFFNPPYSPAGLGG